MFLFSSVSQTQLRHEEGHKAYKACAEYTVWMCKDNLHKSIISLLRVTNVAIYHTFFLTNLHIAPAIIFLPFLSDIYACSDNHVNGTVQQLQIHELRFALCLIDYLFYRHD